MSRAYELYLKDILRAIGRIEILLEEMDEDTFTINNVHVDGVLFNLMTIGEAAKNLPEDLHQESTDIRWRDIKRFRDRIVHHYFSLDMTIVWEIVTLHLPLLKTAVKKLLAEIASKDEDKDLKDGR